MPCTLIKNITELQKIPCAYQCKYKWRKKMGYIKNGSRVHIQYVFFLENRVIALENIIIWDRYVL